MPIISAIMLVFVALALAYTYWSMFRGLVKEHQLSWPLAALVSVIFLCLAMVLFTMLYLLLVAGPVNAGSILGMIFGISLILAGIRTFSR